MAHNKPKPQPSKETHEKKIRTHKPLHQNAHKCKRCVFGLPKGTRPMCQVAGGPKHEEYFDGERHRSRCGSFANRHENQNTPSLSNPKES
jgi:hypothetical protein